MSEVQMPIGNICSKCGADKVAEKVANYSKEKLGAIICYDCQQKDKGGNAVKSFQAKKSSGYDSSGARIGMACNIATQIILAKVDIKPLPAEVIAEIVIKQAKVLLEEMKSNDM